jgi:hypothetical protein
LNSDRRKRVSQPQVDPHPLGSSSLLFQWGSTVLKGEYEDFPGIPSNPSKREKEALDGPARFVV